MISPQMKMRQCSAATKKRILLRLNAPLVASNICGRIQSYHELSYKIHGEPIEVLEYYQKLSPTPEAVTIEKNDQDLRSPENQTGFSSSLGSPMIRIDMEHVPWNPADVNAVQGKYPSPYRLSSQGINEPDPHSHFFDGRIIAGSEGWGRVASTGNASSKFPEGSLVTFGTPGLGTLRSSLWVPETSLLRVRDSAKVIEELGPAGCTLFQLGGTALRMLRDFIPLKKVPWHCRQNRHQSTASNDDGDDDDDDDDHTAPILQNAGNSGVGLMVSQLASSMLGIPVASIVRRGAKSEEKYADMVEYLKNVGKNSIVVAEEDLLSDSMLMQKFLDDLRDLSSSSSSSSSSGNGVGKLPKLALNAVGGDSVKLLLKAIQPGGTMVTYGGMSMKPVTVPTSHLIFKDVRVAGYWHSRWMVNALQDEKQMLIDELVQATLNYNIQCPAAELFSLENFKEALSWHTNQDQISGQRSKLIWKL